MPHTPSDGPGLASHKEAVRVGIERQVQHHVYVTEMESRFAKQPPQQ